jgi:hypothetical protein
VLVYSSQITQWNNSANDSRLMYSFGTSLVLAVVATIILFITTCVGVYQAYTDSKNGRADVSSARPYGESGARPSSESTNSQTHLVLTMHGSAPHALGSLPAKRHRVNSHA